VVARMTPHLRESHPFEALRAALAAIDTLLTARSVRGTGGDNELPNTAIEERGE